MKSALVTEAYQRAIVSISSPQIAISLCQISFFDYAHEVISASFNDTAVSLTKYGVVHPELDVILSTSLQVYVQNFVQLLNASVLPRVNIHGMIHSSEEGLKVSTVVDPVALYLNHTTMLILSTMDKILTEKHQEHIVPRPEAAEKSDLLYDMRIIVVNEASQDIWYRQEGTSECLQVSANSRAAYSWLSLARNPYYRMEFALKSATDSDNKREDLSPDDSMWSDPCVIKENCITGRYFKNDGFLWVCVELNGLQTLVTLRTPVIFRNFCDSPVHLMLNDESDSYKCEGTDWSQQQVGSYKDATHLMADAVSAFRIRKTGSSWSVPLEVDELPAEFDLVKRRSDDRADEPKRFDAGSKKRRSVKEFVTLHSEDPDGVPFYGWMEAHRSECKSVLPNDFDPNQRQCTQRYGWMEVALWPAFTVDNTADFPVEFSFKQKASPKLLIFKPLTLCNAGFSYACCSL